MGGMTEVETGELAARKAVQNDVKVFSQQMLTDHGNANEELKRIAAAPRPTQTSELKSRIDN
jgi:putative membrane protein